MTRLAVLTFDEPEFEPSYAGTRNEGTSIFAWLFFTGRCRFADLDPRIVRSRGPVAGLALLALGFLYALRSRIAPCRTVFDVLRREGVKATFFGVFNLLDDPERRDRYLPVFREIVDQGHELGLHGYSHAPLTETDLERALALAREHLGASLATYSSPFGEDRREALTLLEAHGFIGMRVWDRALLEVTSPVRRLPYDYRLEKVMRSEDPIVVVNLHSGDCYPRGFRRLRRAISTLKRRGYRFAMFRDACAGETVRL
jgi:hypothetical protein